MNNNKNCDLCCKKRARMYCESDEASLCFDCDSKVHSANFLVAKHSRNLLCHSCSNPTPWSASGPKLSPTLSVCTSCIENPSANTAAQMRNAVEERVEENYQLDTYDDHDDHERDQDEYVSSEDDDDSDGEEDDDDGNQVVPLSSSSSPEGSVSSSSGSYGDLAAAGDGGGCSSSPWKRSRESDCRHPEDEEKCSSSLNCHSLLEEDKGTSSSIGFLRPVKVLRTNELCE